MAETWQAQHQISGTARLRHAPGVHIPIIPSAPPAEPREAPRNDRCPSSAVDTSIGRLSILRVELAVLPSRRILLCGDELWIRFLGTLSPRGRALALLGRGLTTSVGRREMGWNLSISSHGVNLAASIALERLCPHVGRLHSRVQLLRQASGNCSASTPLTATLLSC